MILYPNVKLNLGLNVLRKRADGYHDIETLFIPYGGICDRLEIVDSDEFAIDIERDGGVDWDPQQDLTARAWRVLRDDFGIGPVHIRLKKNAPVGAGLGGGSSDAAAALKICNVLFGLRLDDNELERYAARLGSDCAFFIKNEPCIGEGRGEKMTPYGIDLEGYEIKVAIPEGVSVNTAEAYRGVRFHEGMSLRESLARPVSEWKECLVNDFEHTVFALHPEIADLKRRFYEEGAVYAAMSGSGSAVFGLFEKEF